MQSVKAPRKDIQFEIISFYVIDFFFVFEDTQIHSKYYLDFFCFSFITIIPIPRLFDVQTDLKSIVIEHNDDAYI